MPREHTDDMPEAFPVIYDQASETQRLLARPESGDILEANSGVTRNAKLLGPGSAYVIIISRILGTGIFALPSHILSAVGTRTLALIMWILGAFLSYMTLQVFLEFGCMLPRSGGEKTYLEFAYPRPRWLASTVIAVWVVLGGVSSSNCVVFAKYVLAAAGRTEPSSYAVKGIAALLLTSIVVAHGCFYGPAVQLQNMLGIAKIVFLVFLVLTSIYVVVLGPTEPATTPDNTAVRQVTIRQSLVDDLLSDSKISWSVLSTVLFRVCYAYTGIENANNILGEVKDPSRTLKLVAPLALLTALIAYVLVNLAYFAVIPIEELKASGDLVSLLFFQRVFGTGVGELVLSLAVAFSAAGNVMVVIFSMVCLALTSLV